MAMLASKDMQAAGCSSVPSDLSALAAMGTFGQYSNNVHRDLMALPSFQEAGCGTSNHVAPFGVSLLV